LTDKRYLIELVRNFAHEVDRLQFSGDLYVYNPLMYAWKAHRAYLERYLHRGVKILFLGMNPGPFGMAQTGVPFGEVRAVSQWMQINEEISQPARVHPKRPITGFATQRSEVSGKRLWSLMENRFGSAQNFFSQHAVVNYCPLVFVDGGPTGRNIIPEKLPREERQALEQVCDEHLVQVLEYLEVQHLVGIGNYAAAKLRQVAPKEEVLTLLHPSPSNPRANAGWEEIATKQMREAHLWP
jgi:single-strand selective monofunctional uracil DNA glycosylase